MLNFKARKNGNKTTNKTIGDEALRRGKKLQGIDGEERERSKDAKKKRETIL